MLRENDRKWIEFVRPRYAERGTRTGKYRATDKRIRDKVRKGLEDLAYIAEKLPEDQLKQIFTVERLSPMVSAILGHDKKQPKDTDRQLSLAEMFILKASGLWNRPGVYDEMKGHIGWGSIDMTLEHAREVLLAISLMRAKRAASARTS